MVGGYRTVPICYVSHCCPAYLLREENFPPPSLTFAAYPPSFDVGTLVFSINFLPSPRTHTLPSPIPQNPYGKIPCVTANCTMMLIPLFHRCGSVSTTGTRIRKSFIRSSLRLFFISLPFPSLAAIVVCWIVSEAGLS